MTANFDTLVNVSSQEDFNTLVDATFKQAQRYYDGTNAPEWTDEQYDAAVDIITSLMDENPEWITEKAEGLVDKVAAGTASVDGDDTIAHSVPMLSLAKATELDAVRRFVTSVNARVVVEPKIDGIACSAHYSEGNLVQIATRGDGRRGEDLTDRVIALNVNNLPLTIPILGEIEVRGELFMSEDDFTFSNAKRVEAGHPAFANPRNATSGTVMRETVRYEARVSFGLYGVVSDIEDSYIARVNLARAWGFFPAIDLMPEGITRSTLTSASDVASIVARFGQVRSEGNILAPTDGAVVKVDSSARQEALGEGSRHPHWAIAFKYDAIRSTTQLLDIERAVGRTGNISYTAVLSPVFLDGSLVGRATLHNANFISENDLRIGELVVVYKANDIIPRVDGRAPGHNNDVRKDAYVAPTTCPSCGEELSRGGAIWKCITPSCSIVNQISYAVSRDCLDVDGFSTAISTAIVEQGLVSTLSDIFTLTVEELAAVKMGVTTTGRDRLLGSTVAATIVTGMDRARTLPLHRVVTALGIPMTGRGMSRRLAKEFKTMEALQSATVRDFLNSGIDAVGGARADAFFKGFANVKADIDAMRAQGFTMVAQVEDATMGTPRPFEGMKVVVTGNVPGFTRTGAQEAAERLGAVVSGSVSRAVNLVVVGEGAGSKEAKARELNIRIMPAEEFALLAQV